MHSGYDGRQYGVTSSPHDERQWKGMCDDTRVSCYSIHRPSRIYMIWDNKGTKLDDDGWESAIMHELGHALGYEGHASDRHQLMNKYLDIDDPILDVTRKDEDHLEIVY